jgi:hypothetical protein
MNAPAPNVNPDVLARCIGRLRIRCYFRRLTV